MLVNLVKFVTALSSINVLLTIISLLHEQKTPIHRKNVILELARYPDEYISSDITRGAELRVMDTDDVLSRLNDPEMFKDPSKIFLSLRTTNKYHKSRLKILLETWIRTTPLNTWIFSDAVDVWLSEYIDNNFQNDGKPTVIYTDCPSSSDEKYALLCKLYWEYRTFLRSELDWLCHFDDDTYVNVEMLTALLTLSSPDDQIYIGRSPSQKQTTVMVYDTENVRPQILGFNETTNETEWEMPEISFKRASFHYALGSAGYCISKQLALDMKEFAFGSRLMHIASSIAMPDDCLIGYVITQCLNVSLISTDLMHTHLENFGKITQLSEQVTLGYALAVETNKEGRQEAKHRIPENAENSLFFHRNVTNKGFVVPSQEKSNVVNIKGGYSPQEDPTRLKSLHQALLLNNRKSFGER